MVRTVQDHVRLPRLHGRLPDIIAVIVFQLPQGLHRGIIQHPDRLLPVRRLHRIEQVHHIVKRDTGSRRGHSVRSPARGIKNTRRLALPVPGKERLFLLRPDPAPELLGNIRLQVKHTVIQKLIRHFQHRRHLVRPDGNLPERIIRLRVSPFLVNPGSRPLRGSHRNLPVPAGSPDHRGDTPEKVLFLQSLHQRMLKLVRHQIPALGIRPHLQGILHVIKILPPHGIPERLFIPIRRPAFLLFAVRIVVRLIRDRLGDRLIQLRVNRRLPFQPLNLLP